MNRLVFYLLVTASATTVLLRAQGPDQQYLQIYNLIQEADRLSGSGDSDSARVKYLEADTALKKLQASYPNWNDKVIRFRIRYIEERIGSAHSQDTPINRSPEKSSAPEPPPPIEERLAQIRSLQQAIERLQGEKTVLQARLKEALAAQPAVLDPRELAKAEEKIRNLEKEKELLLVALDQAKAQRPAVIEPSGMSALKTSLAEANQRLVEQTEAAAALAREKEILAGRLKELPNEAAVQELRSENEALKKQLARKTIARESAERSSDKTEKQLVDARTAVQSQAKTIAKLQDELSATTKAKAEMERRLMAAYDSSAASDKAAAERIRRLEKERGELEARLNESKKQPAKLSNKSDRSDKELMSLKARLAALEAQRVPFSREELALFKQPTIEPTKVAANSAKSPGKIPPAGAAPLIAEAESAFRSRRYADAETKYQEVLKFDENNSSTLANLAASQLEQKKLEDAEATLKRALAADPNDAHAMMLLGIVKFRQEKFDEAFESLSQSAQIDPQNAETQNYLGITLSQRGQRGPAETALRKAIQLAPGYGSAHNNLAVIYATQRPPFLELARWHYQKALAAGHPKNSDLEKLLETKIASDNK